jgi:hypothetical protein
VPWLTERQALAKWEREETARLKADRDRSRLEREKIDREHYRMRLQEELHALRVQERDNGLKMDEEKVCRDGAERVGHDRVHRCTAGICIVQSRLSSAVPGAQFPSHIRSGVPSHAAI